MYPDNSWYSHRKVLAEYCGLSDRNLMGSIQHGWVNNLIFQNFLIKRKFNFYCWNDKLSKFCINKGFGKIIPIGSPFLYLCKIKKEEIKIKGKGTIVFPSHSNLEDYQKVNHIRLIDIVENKFEGPYKVHFYYTDYYEENFTQYKKRGWEILSSEKRSNEFFLYKLLSNLINSENVISTDISSVFFYAMYLKKKIFLIRKDKNNEDLNMIYRDQMFDFTENYINSNKELFNGSLTLEKQKKIASDELGAKFVLDPSRLKKLLGFGNPVNDFLAKVFSKVNEIKQGNALREGDL
jgi:hypothetical protein